MQDILFHTMNTLYNCFLLITVEDCGCQYNKYSFIFFLLWIYLILVHWTRHRFVLKRKKEETQAVDLSLAVRDSPLMKYSITNFQIALEFNWKKKNSLTAHIDCISSHILSNPRYPTFTIFTFQWDDQFFSSPNFPKIWAILMYITPWNSKLGTHNSSKSTCRVVTFQWSKAHNRDVAIHSLKAKWLVGT